MVAPINATATVKADGETYTFRLNFATIDAARKRGADIFKGLEGLDMVVALTAFASVDQPDFTEDHALALMLHHTDATMVAIEELMGEMGEPEGNVVEPPRKKAT